MPIQTSEERWRSLYEHLDALRKRGADVASAVFEREIHTYMRDGEAIEVPGNWMKVTMDVFDPLPMDEILNERPSLATSDDATGE